MARPKKTTSPKKSPVKSPKIERKQRTKKDPNAPKRGMSAYMFWLKENRPRITQPGMTVVDVTKAAGVEWAKVTDKSKWEKASSEDKKRYEKEMAAFKATGSPKKTAAKKK